ncbi:helix-turn-helix domain-containing protein [Ruegeria sediminis]|nr:helix-turn-helix domain-containing protein [Ruegeria sediminis]
MARQNSDRDSANFCFLLNCRYCSVMARENQILLQACFNDVDLFCDTTRHWDLDFKPLSGVNNGLAAAEVVQVGFGEVEFGSARIRASLDQAGAPPAGRHTLVVLGSSIRNLWWRGRTVTSDDVLIFPEGAEIACFSGPDFLNFCLSVTEQYVVELAERAQVQLPALKRRPEVFRPAPQVIHAARSVLAETRIRPASVSQDAVRDTTDSLVLAWLAQGGVHLNERSPRKGERGLARCLSLIEASPHRQLPVLELCELAGVSRRTLEALFHDRFGVGPAAFMKMRRLASVRSDLRKSPPDETLIGDAMSKYGFMHVGQFAADYRKAFGERPSETLKDGRRRVAESRH